MCTLLTLSYIHQMPLYTSSQNVEKSKFMGVLLLNKIENIVGNVEISPFVVGYLRKCFQNASTADVSECVYKLEMVKITQRYIVVYSCIYILCR